jgi:hypothetical protein
LMLPYSAPDSSDRLAVPGMANVCMLRGHETNTKATGSDASLSLLQAPHDWQPHRLLSPGACTGAIGKGGA